VISRLSEVSATRDLSGVNRPINVQTGTTYTLVFDDRGKILEFNNASAITVTVPADATAPFYDGDVMEVVQTGDGNVTFSPAGGVTIDGFGGLLTLNGQWSSATLIKRTANTWEFLSKTTTAATLTTKGDLLVTTGSALNRLPIGTNDFALLADSTATYGVSWKQIPAASLSSDSVTTAKILNANVTEAKIANNAVTQAKLADRAVGSAELTSLTLNAQTVSYTPVLADAHKLVTMNSGSALNFTIPTDASVNFQIGDQINILQLGSGVVTISAVTPGTTSIVSQGSKLKTNGQYAMATAVKVAANNWVVVGNLAV
jgi:hypothetical protein